MTDFVVRVGQYQVVKDTQSVASSAYNWAKAKDGLNIFANVESAANSLANVIQPILGSGIVRKLDDVVCHQVLDRVESLCPTLKEASTEELLGPVANRAVDLAETCANYCLPADEASVTANTFEETVSESGRLERLSRIHLRAKHQSLSLFNSSLERAHNLLHNMYQSGSSATQHLVSSASVTATLAQVTSILSFASKTAKAVSVPLLVQGLDTVLSQTEKLDHQLKESGKLEWLHLERVIHGLEKVRSTVANEQDIAAAALPSDPNNESPEKNE